MKVQIGHIPRIVAEYFDTVIMPSAELLKEKHTQKQRKVFFKIPI